MKKGQVLSHFGLPITPTILCKKEKKHWKKQNNEKVNQDEERER